MSTTVPNQEPSSVSAHNAKRKRKMKGEERRGEEKEGKGRGGEGREGKEGERKDLRMWSIGQYKVNPKIQINQCTFQPQLLGLMGVSVWITY